MPSASSLDAVTVDAFGTLLLLEDPAGPLRAELAAVGVVRDDDAVRNAFRAEARFYRPRSLRGRDSARLQELRTECVGIFLAELDAGIEPASFVDPFMRSISFRLADGAEGALSALGAAGLSLACVANWDVSLHDHLAAAGIDGRFAVVQSSAEAGFEKPDPRIFQLALERLGVAPDRALHIGDEEADHDGAAAAGMAFEPVPLATLPVRLGL